VSALWLAGSTDPLHSPGAMTHAPPSTTRLIVLDLARSLAIVCMVAFHFTFDLALFGVIPSDTMSQPFWYYFARMIAGSFLFLSGVSLWLAHGQSIRWRAFWTRFAKVACGAVLVSLASIWFVPGGTILFGILHAIAATSLLGLIALRLPWPVTLAMALAIFAAAWGPRFAVFDPLWLVWTGLAESRPMMGDYVPLVPWAAPALAGIALAKAVRVDQWPGQPAAGPLQLLSFPGRHSLLIYLIHQPVLIGCFRLWFWLTTA
jgi:uncharacterized membrane protein